MRIVEDYFVIKPAAAARLFLASVRTIEMAVSSYCNRRCPFCPNAVIDRHSARRFMTDELYSSILGQLAALGWAGSLRFHRYNEPLADRPTILRRIDEARRTLPQAGLTLFSNGDYLTPEFLGELYDAGLRAAVVTVYPPDGAEAALRDRLLARLAALGLPYALTRDIRGHHQAAVAYRDMDLILRACDFTAGTNGADERMTFDRGGVVAAAAPYRRESPCLAPFTQMQVEWDGTLLPCCNLLAEVHGDAVIGKLDAASDIVQAWTGAGYVAWRRALFAFAAKSAPCAGCCMDVLPDTEGMRADVAAIRARYRLD